MKMDNKPKNILITGAYGQLGRCLQDLSKREPFNRDCYFFTDVDTLDITDEHIVEAAVAEKNIDVIINAAAYTAVDKAEEDVENAYIINRDAVANLARVAKKHDALLVHISTDYVFSGESAVPHREDEAKNPLSVYGASKLAGEKEISAAGCRAVVIRTSWLYSEYGNNFVKTMLRLGSERDEVRVVCDQVGGPTYAGDLARAIFSLAGSYDADGGVETYHFANEGVCSWYDFALAIMDISGSGCKVKPVTTAEYAVKARRPSFSVFDLSKVRSRLDFEIPYWRDSLQLTINKLALS